MFKETFSGFWSSFIFLFLTLTVQKKGISTYQPKSGYFSVVQSFSLHWFHIPVNVYFFKLYFYLHIRFYHNKEVLVLVIFILDINLEFFFVFIQSVKQKYDQSWVYVINNCEFCIICHVAITNSVQNHKSKGKIQLRSRTNTNL